MAVTRGQAGDRRSNAAGTPPSAGSGGPDLRPAGRTYQYLRIAMVALLIALAVAVAYQSVRQGSLLGSISAYYYTPAQAIFVGALIGLGVAMVALRGLRDFEDVALNVGGMLAPVIAVVPTSRGSDFRAARNACRQTGTVLSGQAPSSPLDCPSVRALEAAAEANVQNNMSALFVAGGVVLAAALLITVIRSRRRVTSTTLTRFGAEYVLPALVYLAGLVWYWTGFDSFVDHAHYVSAAGLFACIVAVVLSNRVRKTTDAKEAVTTVRTAAARWAGWYLALAVAMAAALVAGVLLFVTGVIALFWLEAVLIGLFVVFWVIQTIEQWDTA